MRIVIREGGKNKPVFEGFFDLMVFNGTLRTSANLSDNFQLPAKRLRLAIRPITSVGSS